MNNYAKLIKSHMISFKEALIKHYKKIGLSDIEAITILHLYEQLKSGDNSLRIEYLVNKMTLDEKSISDIVLRLIEKGFIELTYNTPNVMGNTSSEEFSLENVLEKLGEAIDEAENISQKPKPVVFEIVELVESRFNRIVTPTEVDIIKMWIEKDVTKLEIEQALIECVKAKKTTCQYADAIIVNRQNQKQRVSTNYDPKIKEVLDLFDARYKK